MSKIVLNDVFKDWLTHGIISHLTLNYNVPWKNTVEGSILDLEYHGNRSGNKIISPLVEKLITKDGISLSNETKLCGLIYTKNITRWTELWKSLELYSEFNPLDNVNEITDHTVTKTGTDSNVFNKGTETDTLTSSNTTNIGSQTSTNNIGEQIITQESDIAGFNSSYQDANKTTTNNGSHTDTSNISERSDSSSDTSSTVSGEREDNSTTTYNTTETTSIRRHGNIGVTTSGQLIDDFRRVVDWQFFDTVFSDIDKIVVISTYGELHDSLDGLVINNNYVLNPATKDILGGIKVGNNLTITADGRLSATADTSQIEEQINNITTTLETELPKKYSADNQPPYPVTSVNGKTGNVEIDIPIYTPTEIKLTPTIYHDRYVSVSNNKTKIASASATVTTLVFDVSQYKGKYLKINYFTSNIGITRSRIGFTEDITIGYVSQTCKLYVYVDAIISAYNVIPVSLKSNISNPSTDKYSTDLCNSIVNPLYITQESNYLVIQMAERNISDEDILCDVRVIL